MRKERVIHTRVPALLEQELKKLAENWRVPVSNVVRTILEDALAAVQSVGHKAGGEVRGLAERLAHKTDGSESGPTPTQEVGESTAGFDELVGFQPMILLRAWECDRCGKKLARGQEAFLAVRLEPGPRIVIGRECLPSEDVD